MKYLGIKIIFGIKLIIKCPELIPYLLPEKIKKILTRKKEF